MKAQSHQPFPQPVLDGYRGLMHSTPQNKNGEQQLPGASNQCPSQRQEPQTKAHHSKSL